MYELRKYIRNTHTYTLAMFALDNYIENFLLFTVVMTYILFFLLYFSLSFKHIFGNVCISVFCSFCFSAIVLKAIKNFIKKKEETV